MDDKELKLEYDKLRFEYWIKRLDHTHTHTETTSKLIYLVDGVVIGLLAFVVEKLRPSGVDELYLAPPILFLALLNFYHAKIIMKQRSWYNALTGRIRELLQENVVKPQETASKGFFGIRLAEIPNGTHHIHSYIHWSAFIFLFFAAFGIVAHVWFAK